MKIRFGSRDSRLAVIQSQMVMEAVQNACPQAEPELVTMKTTGDKILDKTLDQIGGKGLFVKELDLALREGKVDFTVHSLKDMPMETPEDLPLAAFSKRADPRDVLVLPEGVPELRPGKPIGCSSRRRQLQLKALYPDFDIAPIRGNVQTRLRKLDEGQYSAAGQAILAVQIRKGTDTSVLRTFHNAESAACALAERAFVRELDGGCTSPVAAYAQTKDGKLLLAGLYVSPDETVIRRDQAEGPIQEAENLGRELARKLKGGCQ